MANTPTQSAPSTYRDDVLRLLKPVASVRADQLAFGDYVWRGAFVAVVVSVMVRSSGLVQLTLRDGNGECRTVSVEDWTLYSVVAR